MSFLSIEFSAVFFIFFIIYWGLRSQIIAQNILLLVSSYLFVGLFNTTFALILGVYTVVIYALSQCIARWRWRKFWLAFSIIIAIGNLAVFKYYNFFINEFQSTLAMLGLDLSSVVAEILLPIGISFYTFHSISYLVSIYRKEIQSIGFLDFALFLSFFPSVIAGPINRAKDFLPQIQTKKLREVLEPHRALMLILLAVAKVYWLSAIISQDYVKPVFDNPASHHTLELIAGLYAYAIEIYLNFSGYTDLVTGIALLLGFRLPINFNAPYLAHNLREFWNRWHISLSTWIRDYVYFPLGGNRKGFTCTQINVMLAMVLSGLWHGETLNFLIWGAIHGVGIVGLNLGDRIFKKNGISQYSQVVARFLTLTYVCIGWLFFRSATFDDASGYIFAMMNNYGEIAAQHDTILFLAFLLGVYLIYPWLAKIPNLLMKFLQKTPWLLLPLVLVAMLWLIVDYAPSGIPQFIYASF